ncbi:MAG: alpha/beta fold hydrolase [Candidatus Shapirobacteria bacterium]|jgi:hypothetical protein
MPTPNKKALILYCWYGDSDSNWYPWLKAELEKIGYQVFVPQLPTMKTDLPDLESQLQVVEKTLVIDNKTLVIGHSLGSVLALRLAEKYKFEKMILVSGWDFNDLTPEHQKFWQNPTNHQLIKNNVKEIFYLTSDNDPYFTAFQTEEMSKRLGAKFILVNGAGHFTKDNFGITQIPKILELL